MAVVLAALVTASATVIVVLIQRMDRRNSNQHDEGRLRIESLHDDVRDVKGDVREIKADVRDLSGRVSDLEST